MIELDFAGRTAVVTGGAQGIGAAIAKRLRSSGAKVAIWDLDESPRVDVADAQSVQAATDRAIRELGKIDVLVNNAGIAGPSMPVVDYPVGEWKRVIDIDLNGPFLCSRAVVPHMVKAGYGRIVNIASIAGKEGNPNAAAYAAAKGGLIAFTKALGKELAKTGVLVNCVTPAAAQTAILDQVRHFRRSCHLLKSAAAPNGSAARTSTASSTVAGSRTAACRTINSTAARSSASAIPGPSSRLATRTSACSPTTCATASWRRAASRWNSR